jgi:hypothetical protein
MAVLMLSRRYSQYITVHVTSILPLTTNTFEIKFQIIRSDQYLLIKYEYVIQFSIEYFTGL